VHGLRHSVQESIDVRLSGKYRTLENVGFPDLVGCVKKKAYNRLVFLSKNSRISVAFDDLSLV